jgi:hypothetical protein
MPVRPSDRPDLKSGLVSIARLIAEDAYLPRLGVQLGAVFHGQGPLRGFYRRHGHSSCL